MNSLKNCSDARHSSIRTGHRLPLKISVLAMFCFGVFVQSCGRAKEEMGYREKSAAVADSVAAYLPGLATDTIGGITHNFIRSANLKCRMHDVLAATKQIEDLVSEKGGYASKSELASAVDYSTSIRFAKDSVAEQVYYTTTNAITLRIPNRQLDSVLRRITDMAVFIDYRTLKSDDVKMKLFANSLVEKRIHTYTNRVEKKTDTKDPKLNHVVAAEESILAKQMVADEKQVQSYDLADQVNYSTVVLQLYEMQKSFSRKALIPLIIEPYTSSFFEKFGTAFVKGFEVLKNFMLFIAESWSVFLIFFLIFIGVRKAIAFYNKRYVMK